MDAFRDYGALLERATRLTEENEALRDELARVRAEREVPENLDAFQRRLMEERDELAREVDRLRERLGERDNLVAHLHRAERAQREATLQQSVEHAIGAVFTSLQSLLRRER